MMNDDCPTLEMWLDWRDGRLGAADAARLDAHRAGGCVACATVWGGIWRLTEGLAATREAGLSDETRLNLRAIAAARLAPRERPVWIARLLQTPRAAVGARGESEAVSLRYEAEGMEIRVWAEPLAAGHWYVIGSVYSASDDTFVAPEGTLLVLDGGESAGLSGRLEETEFHLDDVLSGNYRLEVRLAGGDILLPGIALG